MLNASWSLNLRPGARALVSTRRALSADRFSNRTIKNACAYYINNRFTTPSFSVCPRYHIAGCRALKKHDRHYFSQNSTELDSPYGYHYIPNPQNDSTSSTKEESSATEILLNVLASTPPTNAGDVLTHISNGRSIHSTAYLQAVIESISEEVVSDVGDRETLMFKPQFVSFAVCESLLDAISKTRISTNATLIDVRAVIALFDFAKMHKWDIDRIVLTRAVTHLAKTLCIELIKHIQKAFGTVECHLPESSEPDVLSTLFDLTLATVVKDSDQIPSLRGHQGLYNGVLSPLVDRALEILYELTDCQGQKMYQQLCTYMIQLLCAYGRTSDAEHVFSLADNTGGKYAGTNVASMMSMYYRGGDAERADALFEGFKDVCESSFKDIQNATVMPDNVSLQVEKWQLTHNEEVETPNVISTDQLRICRNRHSAPFFRRALEALDNGEVELAVACLGDARYKGFIDLRPDQLDILITRMVGRGYLADAFGLFTSFCSSMNPTGGTGIAACHVVLSDLPGHLGLGVMLNEYGCVSDWNRIWQIISSVGGMRSPLLRVGIMQSLLQQALLSNDQSQAIRLASNVAELVFRDGCECQSASDASIRRLFDVLVKQETGPSKGEHHLFAEVVEMLLHKAALEMGSAYQDWNARIIQRALDAIGKCTLSDSFRLWNGVSVLVSKYGLSKQHPVCLAITGAAVGLLDSVPSEHRAVPITSAQIADSGWDGFVRLTSSDEYKLENHGLVWECMLDALTRSACCQYPKSLFKYILLVFKLAFLDKSLLRIHVVNAANELLIAANQPAIDPKTNNLLSCYSQASIQSSLQSPGLGSDDAKRTAAELAIEIPATDSKPVDDLSTVLASQPPGSKINYKSPLQKKIEWYTSEYNSGRIPPYWLIRLVLKDTMSKGLGNYWKTIVHDHTPRYLKLLEAHSKGAHSLRRKFATSVWSQAIHRYATQGEVEEAVDLFRRIIKLGGYPVSQAPASLLISLTKTSLPLPVLPKDWQGAPRKVFNMEPAYPPQGTSSADLFIVPANVAERARIVAEIGLAMLYSMLRRELWPTTYFYCVLFSVLGNACMDSELKHIFSRVMPFAIRAMPAKFRIRPELMSSPTVWTMAIKAAVNCGCRPLAEHWFKEYRMSAMSIFRDDASAYSRFAFHGQPQYVRLYDLSRPYYQIFPKKWHWDQRGDTSTFVYDLQEVESQLELDRLRALDKLPLGYAESATMLNIYTLVNEHRDMHSAEILAEEIQSLHIDKCVPKASKPRGHSSLAYCWRMMVVGYINELRQVSVLPMPDGHETYTIKRLERRLSYWFKQWRDAFEMVTINSNERKSDIFILSNEELSTAERISRGIDN